MCTVYRHASVRETFIEAFSEMGGFWDMKEYCFGVDIGGTTVKMGLFKTDGTLLKKWEIRTRSEEKGKLL